MILAAKIFMVCWFILEQTYILNFLKDIQFKTKKYIISVYLFEILLCLKCLTFWSILIITQNIWYSLLFSFIASIYQKKK